MALPVGGARAHPITGTAGAGLGSRDPVFNELKRRWVRTAATDQCGEPGPNSVAGVHSMRAQPAVIVRLEAHFWDFGPQ